MNNERLESLRKELAEIEAKLHPVKLTKEERKNLRARRKALLRQILELVCNVK